MNQHSPDPHASKLSSDSCNDYGGIRGNNDNVIPKNSAKKAPGKILKDVTEAIGNTPLVELSRLARKYGISEGDGRIVAKLEYLQPGFSKKDRIALSIIQDAVSTGELQPGQTVVELTSGNTGTGLAIVCSVMGFPFVAVMSRGNSTERARMMHALGAEVVLVDQAPGSQPGRVSGNDLALVEERAQSLTRERNAFRADQFRRSGNARAYYDGTGPELWNDSDGTITAFVDFVGTGGTFGGCAAYFKRNNLGVKCYVVEPTGAAVLAGHEVSNSNHRIQGGGYIMNDLPQLKPSLLKTNNHSTCGSNNGEKFGSKEADDFDEELVDGYLQVSDEDAIHVTRDLAKYEGIFAGFSAGANVAAAIDLLLHHPEHKGGTVAVLMCDSGLKYLSTDLWKESP